MGGREVDALTLTLGLADLRPNDFPAGALGAKGLFFRKDTFQL